MTRKIKASNIATGAITAAVLDNSGVTAGSYGSSTAIPVLTVNAKGQVTVASTASLPANLATETYVSTAISNISVTPTTISDQANTSTGYLDLPAGTTAQRPASPNVGYVRYNTTLGFLEQYNADGWQGIAPPPIISSVSPTAYNGEQSTTFTISGSSFDASVSVKFITAQGTEYTASNITRVSSTEITAQTPQDFTVANGPLSVKVTGGSGLFGIVNNVIATGAAPAWVTASGSLATVNYAAAVSLSVSASDSDASATIVYSVISGALPTGVNLNTSTGAITGTAPSPSTDTTYTFTLRATDNAGNTATDRSFSISVLGTTYSTEVMIVAGGGGGGLHSGGGGGAGGLLYYGSQTPKTPNGSALTVNRTTAYSVVVGAGGAGSSGTYTQVPGYGYVGNDSAFSSYTALGGGAGGSGGNSRVGGNGGSGGGGGRQFAGGSGTTGQGFGGGYWGVGGAPNYPGGGGGGAGGVGTGGDSGVAGSGGVGLYYSAFTHAGSPSGWFAGGGGGNLQDTSDSVGPQGAGGNGGGANGRNTGGVGNPGVANTGGGGGANNYNTSGGGPGGSGIVILRYAGAQRGTGGTVTSSGGYTIHTFTSSGTFTA